MSHLQHHGRINNFLQTAPAHLLLALLLATTTAAAGKGSRGGGGIGHGFFACFRAARARALLCRRRLWHTIQNMPSNKARVRRGIY